MFFNDIWKGNTLRRTGESWYSSKDRHEYKKIDFEINFSDVAQLINNEFSYLIEIGFIINQNPSLSLDVSDPYSNSVMLCYSDYKITLTRNDIDVLVKMDIRDGKFGYYSVELIRKKKAEKVYSANISLENLNNRITISSFITAEVLNNIDSDIIKGGVKPDLLIFPLRITCPICHKGKIEFVKEKQKLKCNICKTRIMSSNEGEVYLLLRKGT